MDDLILQSVNQIDCVLNLGAGLDTRAYRLPLPTSLDWIEVDLPELLAEKDLVLRNERSQCRLQRIPVDLGNSAARQALLAQISAGKILVITEGLLGYLSEAQVREIACDLYRRSNVHGWLLELFPPLLQKQWQQSQYGKIYNDYFNNGRPAFQFAPEAGPNFFRPLGWTVAEQRYFWHEASQLRRMGCIHKRLIPCLRWLAPQFWKAMMQSGIVGLERASSLHQEAAV